MKKWISLLLAGIILIQALSLVGCSKTLITAESLKYEIIPADTEGGIPTITLAEFDGDDVDSYTAPFGFASGYTPSSTTYESAVEGLLERGVDVGSLYLYRIVRALSPEESKSIEGYGLIHDDNCAFYEVELIYDYLKDVEINSIIYIKTPRSHSSQMPGIPPYEPGDAFVSFLRCRFNSNSLYIRLVTVTMVDMNTNVVNSETALYLNKHDETFASFDQDMTESEKNIVTSYKENPVHFDQKVKLDDFVSFVKKDLTERGVYVDVED